jgi:hypothetical protein
MRSVTVSSSGLFLAVGIASIVVSSDVPLYAFSSNGSTWTTPAAMNGSTTSVSINSVTVNSAGLFVAVGRDSAIEPLFAYALL